MSVWRVSGVNLIIYLEDRKAKEGGQESAIEIGSVWGYYGSERRRKDNVGNHEKG